MPRRIRLSPHNLLSLPRPPNRKCCHSYPQRMKKCRAPDSPDWCFLSLIHAGERSARLPGNIGKCSHASCQSGQCTSCGYIKGRICPNSSSFAPSGVQRSSSGAGAAMRVVLRMRFAGVDAYASSSTMKKWLAAPGKRFTRVLCGFPPSSGRRRRLSRSPA